jgi:glycosyltransferase involved in cell wall biosynthesis
MDVLRAAELVLARIPVVFLVAGIGVLENELVAFSRARGIADRVRFLGRVAYERMPELYNAADLVVMASEAEGISRVYIEALACGRPLLASDIPAAREVIEEGRNGFLFKPGDHHDLAERILTLLGDRALPTKIGPSARASVSDRSIERSVQMYVEAIQELIREVPRGRQHEVRLMGS